ncbi:MAG TPA: hypothetical protein VIU11_11380 [Nakamurella sp.]
MAEAHTTGHGDESTIAAEVRAVREEYVEEEAEAAELEAAETQRTPRHWT